MEVTHHNCPSQFVGNKNSDRKYVCSGTWDDLEEESHVSRTMNLWSQGHHRPTVGSSLRDVIEMISTENMYRVCNLVLVVMCLIYTRISGKIRMVELRQQVVLRSQKLCASNLKKLTMSCDE